MTTEKTARAWFEMLKEPYKSQAIKASEETVRISRIEKLYASLSEAILGDFIWEETAEGGRYWDEIRMSIARGETTYLADAEHECKHCGVMTTQPDEECYKATTDTTNGWVKCSDRLPENMKRVMYYNCTENIIGISPFDIVHYKWDEKITHWRELPDPPKHNPCTP